MRKILINVFLFIVLLGGAPIGVNAEQLRDTFRRVKGSVVVVRTIEKTVAPYPLQGIISSTSLASGVLISDDGKVLTAAHAVQAVDSLAVEFAGGQRTTARVVSTAIYADVALLQLDSVPPGLTPARLGDSDKVEVGDEVFVVGAPYGISPTLTVGHVSGRISPKMNLASASTSEFFQTDAAINGGNSGGPMFNLQGEVIGIVGSILSRSGGFEGIGFAATAKMARLFLLERKPFWWGVEGILIQDDIAGVLNLPQPAGFLVQRVAEGSPASRLGVKSGVLRVSVEGRELLLGGDVILSVNGIGILEGNAALDRICESVSNLKPGERIVCKVLRAGQVIELSTMIAPQVVTGGTSRSSGRR